MNYTVNPLKTNIEGNIYKIMNDIEAISTQGEGSVVDVPT
jgi:uncharacterized protein YqgV (UPF0045/DUF77 family)